MTVLDYLIVLLVTCLALFLIALIVASALSGLKSIGIGSGAIKLPDFTLTGIRSLIEHRSFSSYPARLAKIDNAVESGNSKEACTLLRNSFYFAVPRSDRIFIEKINRYHDELLVRLLAITSMEKLHSKNVAMVEDLLISRNDALLQLVDAVKSYDSFKRKVSGDKKGDKASERKSSAKWAHDQYLRQITELEDQLRTNQVSLNSVVGQIIADLSHAASKPEENITYH